jgi:Lipocalin-like domain
MKNVTVGQTVEILANIGVIASLVLLAYQLQQNNKLMTASIAATRLTENTALWGTLAEQPGIAEMLLKDRHGEELAPAEELRLDAIWMRMLTGAQFTYQQAPDLGKQGLPAWRRAFMSYGSLRRIWNGVGGQSVMAQKDDFSAEFVKFMGENAFTQNPDAQDAPLTGVWRLLKYDVEFKDGSPTAEIFGDSPPGYLIFTPKGRMMAVFEAAGRTRGKTEAELAALYLSTVAYTGTYQVEGNTWTTKVDASWSPTMREAEQARFYNVDGDKREVTTAWAPDPRLPGKSDARQVLVWQKVE